MHPKRSLTQPIRALVLAELCNPDWVSVPLEGWSLWASLSRLCGAHLVTHVQNRHHILKEGMDPARFTFIDPSLVEVPAMAVADALRGYRGSAGTGQTLRTAFSLFHYAYFEQQVWALFGERIKRREFDLVHRLTPISPTMPSSVASRCERAGVPFTIGPLNGGVPWPKGFDSARLKEREWLSYVRDLYKLVPGYTSTRRNARAILTGSRDTRAMLGPRWQEKSVYVPENAVEPKRFDRTRDPRSGPVRVAFVGRLVPYKGADMLLEAAAPLVRAGKLCVDAIGDGPEMERLRALAVQEQLGAGVQFAGWVKHQELKGRLACSQVFGFPSIREFGGAVVLEAMALGLVPVVVDYGGPGELVSPGTGFAVPMGQREAIVRGVREVLEKLVAHPELLDEMGPKARARVLRSFTWDVKAAQVLEVWRWVLGQRDKPDFGMPLPDPT